MRVVTQDTGGESQFGPVPLGRFGKRTVEGKLRSFRGSLERVPC